MGKGTKLEYSTTWLRQWAAYLDEQETFEAGRSPMPPVLDRPEGPNPLTAPEQQDACREARDFIGTCCTCPELDGDGSCPACVVYYQLHEVLSEMDERSRPSEPAAPSAPSPG
jgi:hypothetical protein